jgi:hypothetical protein
MKFPAGYHTNSKRAPFLTLVPCIACRYLVHSDVPGCPYGMCRQGRFRVVLHLVLCAVTLLVIAGGDVTNAELLLFVDGYEMARCPNFKAGFAALFAAYFVFNICYSHKSGNFWEMVQRCVLSPIVSSLSAATTFRVVSPFFR